MYPKTCHVTAQTKFKTINTRTETQRWIPHLLAALFSNKLHVSAARSSSLPLCDAAVLLPSGQRSESALPHFLLALVATEMEAVIKSPASISIRVERWRSTAEQQPAGQVRGQSRSCAAENKPSSRKSCSENKPVPLLVSAQSSTYTHTHTSWTLRMSWGYDKWLLLGELRLSGSTARLPVSSLIHWKQTSGPRDKTAHLI